MFNAMRIILCLSLLLAGQSALAGEPEGYVLCYGDSMTANAKSYVSILDQKWSKTRMINAGRGGRKTSERDNLVELLARTHKAEEKQAAAGKLPIKITWAFILLGANDLKARASDATVDKCAENMAWMIDYLRQDIPDVKILLLSPCTLDVAKMKESGYETQAESVKRIAALETAYKKVAGEKNVKFISLLNVVPPANLSDGLHPDPAGQALIAEAIMKGFGEEEASKESGVKAASTQPTAEAGK